MRLIDADAVIKEIERQAGCAECDNYNGIRCRACSWDDARGLVDDYADNHPMPEQPEIVRCEDCKNWAGNGANVPELPYWLPCKGVMRQPDYFCADGIRKEKGNDPD